MTNMYDHSDDHYLITVLLPRGVKPDVVGYPDGAVSVGGWVSFDELDGQPLKDICATGPKRLRDIALDRREQAAALKRDGAEFFGN